MVKRVLILAVMLGSASVARAGATVELAPSPPGPYSPGETVTITVNLINTEEVERLLRGVQWDFIETEPAIVLGSNFTWDIDPPFGGLANDLLPVPNWASLADDNSDPSLLFVLPPNGTLSVGSLDVVVNDSGWVDAFHSDWQFDINQGARVTFGFGGPDDPITEWFSYGLDGAPPELTGGTVFLEVPEPATLAIFALAAAAIMRRRPEN